MRKRGNKVLIIALIVIALIAIIGGVFAYLYFATDMFKSGQQLFAKYLIHNLSEVDETVNLATLDTLEDRLNENKYEENIVISYTEAEETQPYVELTIDTQNDSANDKYYGIIGLIMDDMEKELQLEYMKDADVYSLRFTNSVKQFLSLENKNLKEFAKKLGIDEETLEQIPDSIDFEKFSLERLAFTNEEISTEMIRYSQALYYNIPEEKYTKSKDVVITVNGKTITTNAYILTLNMQDLKNIAIKLLETLKQDEIILAKLDIVDEMIEEYEEESLKDLFVQTMQESIDELNKKEVEEGENIVATVYEEKGKTVRLKIEQGLDSITLDSTEVEGKKQIDMNYISIDEENTQSSNKIVFIKENFDKLKIQFTNIEGEEQQTTDLTVEASESEENIIKIDLTLEDEIGKTVFSRNINIVDEINYNVTLDNSNNLLLNELSKERMSYIFTALGESLNTEYVEPLNTVLTPILLPVMLGMEIVDIGSDAIQNSDLSGAEQEILNDNENMVDDTTPTTRASSVPSDFAPTDDNLSSITAPSDYINTTSSKIIALLRSVGTIVMVMMLIF